MTYEEKKFELEIQKSFSELINFALLSLTAISLRNCESVTILCMNRNH